MSKRDKMREISAATTFKIKIIKETDATARLGDLHNVTKPFYITPTVKAMTWTINLQYLHSNLIEYTIYTQSRSFVLKTESVS